MVGHDNSLLKYINLTQSLWWEAECRWKLWWAGVWVFSVSWSMCFGSEPVIITWNLALADHWTVRWKKQQKGNKSSFCPFRPTPLRFSRNNVVVGFINGDSQWLRLSWKKTHYSESSYHTHSVSNVKSSVMSPHWHLILLYKPQMFRRKVMLGGLNMIHIHFSYAITFTAHFIAITWNTWLKKKKKFGPVLFIYYYSLY